MRMNSVKCVLVSWVSGLSEAWALPFLASVPSLPILDHRKRVTALGWVSAGEHTFRVHSQTLIPLGDGSYMRAHAHTPRPIHVLVHTSHPYMTLFVHTHHTPYIPHTHTYFYHLHEPHKLHTVTIYTSLVHMPGVGSHKQMTYLHHVHTYSTFTHCLPLLASIFSPAHRLSQTGAPTACALHTLSHPPAPPLMYHHGELLPPTAH